MCGMSGTVLAGPNLEREVGAPQNGKEGDDC